MEVHGTVLNGTKCLVVILTNGAVTSDSAHKHNIPQFVSSLLANQPHPHRLQPLVNSSQSKSPNASIETVWTSVIILYSYLIGFFRLVLDHITDLHVNDDGECGCGRGRIRRRRLHPGHCAAAHRWPRRRHDPRVDARALQDVGSSAVQL